MFRLDKVLDLKERQEKELRAGRLMAEAQAAELDNTARRLVEERRSLPDGGTDVETLLRWSRYSDGLRRREASVRQRRKDFQAKLEVAVQRHLELRQEVEGLKRLKERTLARRKKLRDRRAQEAIDDVAARPFVPGGGKKFPPGASREEMRITAPDRGEAFEAEIGLKWGTEA